jgi:hypothetical protein
VESKNDNFKYAAKKAKTNGLKTFTAKRLRSFDFRFALFEAFDTPVSAASQNTDQFSKSAQAMLNFQHFSLGQIARATQLKICASYVEFSTVQRINTGAPPLECAYQADNI